MGVGELVAVDEAELRVTIRHDDIPGLMPAMTMEFPVASAEVLAGASAGTAVRFDLLRRGDLLTVTRLLPAAEVPVGRPGVHDHRPHHGGVVAMAGLLHLETVASPSGGIQVYLTDVWRRPLPLDGVTGSVRLDLPGGPSTLALVARDGVLEATSPPLTGAEIATHVTVRRNGEPLEVHYVLPLRAGVTGAALVPTTGCTPPAPATAGERVPRCILGFPSAITAVASPRDGTVVVISVLNGGVTVWRMPEVTLVAGFAPPPPTVVSVADPPHAEAASSIALSPDGREAMVVVERRLLRYSVASGRLARELPAMPAMVRALAWSSDGGQLLVTVFGDPGARVLDARDGHEVRRIPVAQEGAAVAVAPEGRLAAVGDETGTIVLVEPPVDGAPRPLADTRRAVSALAIVEGRVIAGGPEGVLRTWNAESGRLLAESPPGPAILRLAVAPGGHRVATVDIDRAIRLRDVATGATLETLRWHDADTYFVAWSGSLLLAGGNDGQLALWDLADSVKALP